ncbi:unnamed protein product [Peniophora sp. CBMAI 1063]|nr:unnamed protein product [Peniophora sp. CBMAI 1063]
MAGSPGPRCPDKRPRCSPPLSRFLPQARSIAPSLSASSGSVVYIPHNCHLGGLLASFSVRAASSSRSR